MGALLSLRDALDADVRAEACDDEPLAHVEAAGEGRLVLRPGLALLVIPELAVGAVAVPAEVAVGDGLDGEELEAAQQAVALGHLDPAPENLYRDQPLVGVEQVCVELGLTRLFHRGLTSRAAVSESVAAERIVELVGVAAFGD